MEQLINFITGVSIWSVAKIFVLLGLIVYLVFGWVVVRQVDMMTETVSGEMDFWVKAISRIHFLFSVGVIILSLTIL